ncbi:MAG: hypothetical protein ACJ71H_15105 [Nitrososphaeraceae archaeon]
MYKKQLTTTALAILAIATAISLVTASNSGRLVTPVFAVKNTDKNGSTSTGGSSTSKKDATSTDTSTTTSSLTSSEKKFFKCVEAIPGKISKADIDSCYDEVFGSSGKTPSSSSTTGRNSGGSSPQFGGLSLGSGT